MLRYRTAETSDIDYLVPRLRDADLQEIQAASGMPPGEALAYGFVASDEVYVGVDGEDRPLCIGGIGSADHLSAIVWMLASKELEKHSLPFLRLSKPFIQDLNNRYPILTNHVDERNTLHIRWLRWLGFTFINRHPHWGTEKRPFLEFVRINDV